MSSRSIRLAVSLAMIAAGARAETLEQVLAHIDANAKTFTSFTAKFKLTDYEKVLDSSDVSTGTVNVKRVKDTLTGELTYDDGHLAFFDGKTFDRYFPRVKQQEIYDLGKQTSSLVKVFLLGFGTSRAELLKDFEPSMGGPESVDGQATTRIVLKPKTKEQKEYMVQMELWIPEGKGYPVQEKVIEPSNNTKTIAYSAMQLPAPAGTAFQPVLPKDVKKVYPGR